MNMKYSNKTYEDILNWLDTNLTQDRYIHTLGTVDTAVMLAERFNLDIDKAIQVHREEYSGNFLLECFVLPKQYLYYKT